MTDFFTPTSADIGRPERLSAAHTHFEAKKFSLGMVTGVVSNPFAGTDNTGGTVSMLRGLFGFNAPLMTYESDMKMVSALFEKPNLITAICTQSQSDGWWIKLLLDKKPVPQIFGKITTLSHQDHAIENYLLSMIPEDISWATTVIGVETGQAVSKQWIQDALLSLNLPVKLIFDTLATHTGKCLHLIEVNRSLKDDDPNLSLHTEIDEIELRIIKKVGGYN